jgi:hypothetical protein
MMLLVPEYSKSVGKVIKTYPEDGMIFYASFKSYGGTEHKSNDLWVIEDTAQILTWYNPLIKSDCRVKRMVDGAVFDIINEPENIDMRNQYVKFKVRRQKGGI